jgi:hypothetical protein
MNSASSCSDLSLSLSLSLSLHDARKKDKKTQYSSLPLKYAPV